MLLFEPLAPSPRTTAQLYCQQMDRLAGQVQLERPNHRPIRFRHDSSRPKVVKITLQKLLKQGLELLIHPPYSLDLALPDYHLFLSLSTALRHKTFSNKDDLNQGLEHINVPATDLNPNPESFIVMALKVCPKIGRK